MSFQIQTNVIQITVIMVVKIYLVLTIALVEKVTTWLELADVLVNFYNRGIHHLSIFTDVNECGYNNGNCSHKCVNMAGTYRCECPSEYTLLSNKRDCFKGGEYLTLLETAMHQFNV